MMKKEKSCGAVVTRQNAGKMEILLIRHKNGGHWAFPKGHVEGKETEEETALREIWEETGLQVTLDREFRTVVSYSPKPGVGKDVVYFGAECCGGKPVRQEAEILSIVWMPAEEAIKQVTFENDKKVLEEFLQYHGK